MNVCFCKLAEEGLKAYFNYWYKNMNLCDSDTWQQVLVLALVFCRLMLVRRRRYLAPVRTSITLCRSSARVFTRNTSLLLAITVNLRGECGERGAECAFREVYEKGYQYQGNQFSNSIQRNEIACITHIVALILYTCQL